MLVPNAHWVVIEDSEERTKLVSNLISDSGLKTTHLVAKTPPFEKLKAKVSTFNFGNNFASKDFADFNYSIVSGLSRKAARSEHFKSKFVVFKN